MDRVRPSTLPIPPALLIRAIGRIERSYAPIPFEHNGVEVTRELLSVAMEELNAEATRTLALAGLSSRDGVLPGDRLDRRLASRGFSGDRVARSAADVLIGSGIAALTSVSDRRSRRFLRAVRLLPGWTWTILAGEDVSLNRIVHRGGDDTGAAWTSLCPVCRAGRLVPVTGQELFGVPGKDFLACTSCGARFVPDGEKFRLVSILHRRDPLWSDLLNREYTGSEWKAIAETGFLPGTRHGLPLPGTGAGRRQPSKPRTAQSRTRFPLEIGDRTLYFTPIPLSVEGKKERDLFRGRREPVCDILELPAFHHLKKSMGELYRPYLDFPIGAFLAELKGRRDAFYRQYLHPFGDLPFCTFRAGRSSLGARCGVYIVVAGTAVQATGVSFCPFRETIDTLLGRITPAACYIDGDPDRCRINTVVCRADDPGVLYGYVSDDHEEIARLGLALAERFAGQGT